MGKRKSRTYNLEIGPSVDNPFNKEKFTWGIINLINPDVIGYKSTKDAYFESDSFGNYKIVNEFLASLFKDGYAFWLGSYEDYPCSFKVVSGNIYEDKSMVFPDRIVYWKYDPRILTDWGYRTYLSRRKYAKVFIKDFCEWLHHENELAIVLTNVDDNEIIYHSGIHLQDLEEVLKTYVSPKDVIVMKSGSRLLKRYKFLLDKVCELKFQK